MTDQERTGDDRGGAVEGASGKGGERRGSDRRGRERRRDDRRTPLPIWRRPAAFVAYGVVGAMLVLLLFRGRGADEADARSQAVMVERIAMEEEQALPVPANGPSREAFTLAQYARLVAEGEDAVGEVVRTELYCGSISPVNVRTGERVNPALVELADAEGRVAGAECRWSREARSSDFLLIVPPDLAEQFAGAPEVDLNFVRRRRISADIEWLGRPEALALRNAGVLKVIRS